MTMILDGSTGEVFPTWTTATRPASPVTSQTGWNTTIASLENYNGTAWTAVGGGGPGQMQTVQTSNFAAVSGNVYAVNTTSSAITVTLPASPSAGNFITIIDYARTFTTNACTINPNGLKIAGTTTNTILASSGTQVTIVYVDATQGWLQASGNTQTFIGGYSVSYLVVAGGGGSGELGGGGGAGGVLSGTSILTSGSPYTITIGAGSAGTGGTQSSNGSNSVFGLIATGIGGGAGPYYAGTAGNGGSGGGGNRGGSAAGTGTANQGNSGGVNNTGNPYMAGGGGGGGASGGNASGSTSGAGGAGTISTISGTSVYYGGGGGGGAYSGGATNAGSGGTGGGGAGQATAGAAGTNGTANLGGGGGGGGASGGTGGNGGSGIVIISYVGAQRGTGGTVTSSGGYTIHTFTTSGTYTA